MNGARRAGRRSGFSLIEILAVVTILGIVAAFVLPNLGAYRSRALRAEAQRLAMQLELGRQRAIVTGIPHRLWFDIDGATYRLEWLAADANSAPGPALRDADFDPRSGTPLPLAAPREAARSFQPVPGLFGRTQALEDPFVFDGLETPQGYISRGESSIVFERDGTASYTEIHITDGAGESIALDVFPLDDRVRVRNEEG